jgi:hypothetical protein
MRKRPNNGYNHLKIKTTEESQINKYIIKTNGN